MSAAMPRLKFVKFTLVLLNLFLFDIVTDKPGQILHGDIQPFQ